jgi:WD40 repeat protein
VFPNREFNWGQIREMAVDATGQRVLLTSAEKLHLFDLKQGKVISEFAWPDNRNLYLHHAEFLPDNRHVAFAVNGQTGWENSELWIGDIKSGVITARLNFQEALRTQSTGVQFHDFRMSPDGRRITSACITHSEVTHPNHAIAVVSWAVPEGAFGAESESKAQPLRFERIQTFSMPGEVSSLAVTPDGQQFVTGSPQRGPATLRGISNGEIIHRLETGNESAQEGPIDSHVAISPDGKRIAECQGTSLRLWDRETGTQQFETSLEDMMEHQGETLNRVHAIRSVAWSPDGEQLLIASLRPFLQEGERRKVFSTAFAFVLQMEEDKANIAGRFEHPDDVNQATFLGEGRLFATACEDGRARIWELDAKSPSLEMRANGEAIVSLDATPDGAYLAAGSADGTWHLWETRFGHRLNHWAGKSAVTAIKFLPQQNHLVTSHKDGHLALWNLSEATETARTPGNGSPTAMALTADGKQLLTSIASKDANQPGIQVWSIPIAE